MNTSSFFRGFLVAVLAFGMMTAFTISSFAADGTWDGGGSSGDWSDAVNWVGDTAPPVAGETATFNETSGNGYPLTNIPTDANVTVTSAGATATVQLPSMNIKNLTVTGHATANVNLTFSGDVTLSGTTGTTIQTAGGGATGNVTVSLSGNSLLGGSPLTVQTLAAAVGSATLSNVGIVSVSTLTIDANGTVTGSATATASGTLTATGASTIDVTANAGAAKLTCNSDFVGTALTISSTAGTGIPTLEMLSNTLDLSGTLTFADAGGNPALTSSGPIFIGDDFVIPAGAASITFAPTGTITFDGTGTQLIDLEAAPGVNLASASIVVNNTGASGTVQFDGGAVTMQNLTVNSTLTTQGAGDNLNITSTLTVESSNATNAHLDMSAGAATLDAVDSLIRAGASTGNATITTSGVFGGVTPGDVVIETTGSASGVPQLILAAALTCVDLTFTDGGTNSSPTFTAAANAVTINGDMTVTGSLSIFAPTGNVTFGGTVAQTVDVDPSKGINLTAATVLVTNTHASGVTTTSPAIVGTLDITNAGGSPHLLTMGGDLTVSSTGTVNVEADATGSATLALGTYNLLGGADITVDADGAGGNATITQSGGGGMVVDQITLTGDTATTGVASLTSGSGSSVPNPNTNNGITASGQVTVTAADGAATLTAVSHFVVNADMNITSTAATTGVPSLIITNNNLTMRSTDTLTFTDNGGDPVFTGGTGTISLGILDLIAAAGQDLTLSFPALTAVTVDLSDVTGAQTISMTGDLTVTTLLDMDSGPAATACSLDMNGNDILGGGNISVVTSAAAAVACSITEAGAITAGTITMTGGGGANAAPPSIAQDVAATGTINASGAITLTSGVNAGTDAALTASAVGGGISAASLTINATGAAGNATVDVTGVPLDLSGALSIDSSGGIGTLTTTTGAINIGGNLTVADASSVFSPNGGGAATLTFDGTAAQTINVANVTLTADSIVVANSGAVCTFATTAVTLNTGTFTVNTGGSAATTAALDVQVGLTTLNGKLTTVAVAQTFTGNVVIGLNGELEATGAATILFDNATANSIDNSSGGVIDLDATATLDIDAAPMTITTGSGGSALGIIDDAASMALTLNGTGNVTLRAAVALANTVLTANSGVTVVTQANVSAQNQNVIFNGPVTVDTAVTFTIDNGQTFSIGGLLTVQGVILTIDNFAATAATLTLNGGMNINSEIISGTNGGDITILVGAGTTVTNADQLTLSGVNLTGERLLLASGTTGSSFNLVNTSTGTLDFEWVAVRDCNLTNSGTVDITLADSVVNATGNSGDWFDTTIFASPVPQGARGITTFTTNAISSTTPDNQTYDFYADTSGTISDEDNLDGTTASAHVNFTAAAQAGSTTAVWNGTDSPALGNSPTGKYYIYLAPAAAQPDINEYVIVSDYTINVSKVVFIASNSDAPTSGSDKVFTSFNIDWTDDADSSATVELRYSTNGTYTSVSDVLDGNKTTRITTVPASTDSNNGTFVWDTSALATDAGATYYVYALNHNGPTTSFDVSAAVVLKGINFTAPADTGATADTASTDPAVITSHTTYTLAWTDWDGATTTGNIDVYVSQTQFTTPAAVVLAVSLTDSATRAVQVGTDLDASAVASLGWDLTTGFGTSGANPVPEAAYFIYAVADDPNGAIYDEVATAPGKVTVVHSPFFYTNDITVTATADSGQTATTPDPITITWNSTDWDDAAVVSIFYALDSTVSANPSDYDSAAEIETNATEVKALDSSGALVLTSQLTGNDALPEVQTSGYSGWNYYDSTVISTTAAGDYAAWVILTDASTDKAFKKAATNVTISHSSNIQVDSPASTTSTTATNKFYTVEWTDVDYDQSAIVNLFYSTTDLRNQSGVGGTLTTDQVATAKGYTKFTATAVQEDADGPSDRFLFDLAGDLSDPLFDNQTYYVYALIDADSDGNYEAGYQSGGLVPERGSSLVVTTPAGSDLTTISYTINWIEEWDDNSNVPINVDVYFDTTNTKTLGDLDDTLGTANAPAGIIERDIALNTDSTGAQTGTNSVIWDDIVLTSTTAPTGGSTTTLIDTSADSPLSASVGNDYYIGRRLLFTAGTLSSAHTITDYVASTQTITFSPAASSAVSATTVTSYKVVIPDGTYYVYAVLDTSTGTTNDAYNTGIAAANSPVLSGTTTSGSTTQITDSNLTDTANLYVGARLVITSGTNRGVSRTITAYDGTKQLTVSPAFSNATGSAATYRIDVPETFSVSLGTVTITNYTISLVSPGSFHEVGDYFDIDIQIDTNAQAVQNASLHLNFNTTTLELASETQPLSKLAEPITNTVTTSAGSTSGTTLIASGLSSATDDAYNTYQVVVTSGTAKGERATIADYNGSTKTISVDPPFSTQILSGVNFRIDQALTGSANIGPNSWGVTIVQNSGSNTNGQADFIAVSTQPNATAFAATDTFITVTFKTKAAGNTDVTFSYDDSRQTRLIDDAGGVHIPHDGNSVHVRTIANPASAISGNVLLEGRTNHQEDITFELRQPGSLGHYSGYTSPEDTDATAPGIQLQTGTDGGFKLTNVPSGKYFLTAKAATYLRGQNHHTTPLEIVPGKNITGVLIQGYDDANADGDFADSGEEFDFLLAGESGTEDNQITVTDVTAFANNFGLTSAEALDAADVNGDGAVDVDDFQLLAKNFGKTAIPPTGDAGVANAAPTGKAIYSPFELVGLPSEIELGEEIEVEVHLKNGTNVTGYGFDLAFDPKHVIASDAAEGKFLSNQSQTFFISKQISTEKEGKKLTIANAAQTPVSGKGSVLTFTLKPVALGDAVLTIGNPQLHQRDGSIKLDGVSGRYLVRVIPKKVVTKSVLLQNYPNPFNPETWIPFALKDESHVKIHIYNVKGQKVRTLDLGFQKSAEYITRDKAAYWDGRNQMGERIASSVYFYRIEAGDFSATRKMVILK
ncbi:MAG: hypothetical protein O7E52_22390 [Candidatus Poribacteria bacterium]|nr:hypothetical protein [Candidatus Poribacteria bacterium]